MKNYFYKNGEQAKANDICFYSEDDGSHDYHYADGISLIVEHEGILKTKLFVVTMDDGNTFIDWDEPDWKMLDLKWSADIFQKTGILSDLTKIGTYPQDKHMLTKEYANKNFKNEQF